MKEWYESFKQSKWFPLVVGILSVVLGLICLFNPGIRMESIALMAGILFLLYGLLQIVNGIFIKDHAGLRAGSIVLGLIMIVLAILDFANLQLVGKYLPTLTGFFMILCALANLIPSFAQMKGGLKNWWLAALPAIILLVLGLIFLLKPGYVGKTFGIFAGIALLVNGVSNLISFFQMKK